MLNVDFKVSRVGLGAAQIGSTIWSWGKGYNKKSIMEAYDRAFELGLNFVDTAEAYGGGVSEEIVGEIIKGRRDKVFLATKVTGGHLHDYDVMKACEGSLRRLNTDVIDLYQIHGPSSFVPLKETMSAMNRLLAQGKIKYVGVSNFLVPYVKEAQKHLSKGELVSDQVKYNLLQREVERELIPYCKKEGITVIAYSPQAQGLLTGKYSDKKRPQDQIRGTMMSYFSEDNLRKVQPMLDELRAVAKKRKKTMGQVAINWLLKHDAVFPIAGVKRRAQAEEVAGSLGWALTNAEWDDLARASEKIRIDYFPGDS
jgi:aryl-alcohol dehydrogenase-like predicted oxidoreductase